MLRKLAAKKSAAQDEVPSSTTPPEKKKDSLKRRLSVKLGLGGSPNEKGSRRLSFLGSKKKDGSLASPRQEFTASNVDGVNSDTLTDDSQNEATDTSTADNEKVLEMLRSQIAQKDLEDGDSLTPRNTMSSQVCLF
jgi:hypothetical protein